MDFIIGLFKFIFSIAAVGFAFFLLVHFGAKLDTDQKADIAAIDKYSSEHPEVIFVKVWCTNKKEGRKNIKIACDNPIFRGAKRHGINPATHAAYYNYCESVRYGDTWDTTSIVLRNWNGECVTFLKGQRLRKYTTPILRKEASTVDVPFNVLRVPIINYDKKTKQITLNEQEMHSQSGGWYGRIARQFHLSFASNPYWKASGISVFICVIAFLTVIGSKVRDESTVNENEVAAWVLFMCLVWFVVAYLFDDASVD